MRAWRLSDEPVSEEEDEANEYRVKTRYRGSLIESESHSPKLDLRFHHNAVSNVIFKGPDSALISHRY